MTHLRMENISSVLVVFLVGVLVVSAAAPAVAAGTTSDSSTTSSDADNSVTETVWVLTNQDTGETYRFDGGQSLEELPLPAGTYQAEKRVSVDGETKEVLTREVTVDDAGSVSVASHTSGPTQLDVTTDKEYASYTQSESVELWVGLSNRSTNTPIANAPITVEIRHPNGSLTTINSTTNADGNAKVTYDLSGAADGEYYVDVISSEYDVEGFESFTVGERTTLHPDWEGQAEVGEEISYTLKVTESHQPVSGAERTVEIRYPNGTMTTLNVTTDSNGFATFSFTPPESGGYEVNVVDTNNYVSTYFRAGTITGALTTNGGSTFLNGGQTFHFQGFVKDNGVPLANEELTLVIVNETDWDDTTVVRNISVTTDNQGAFTAQWESPEINKSGRDLQFTAYLETSSGERVATDSPYLWVEGPSATSSSARLQVELENYSYPTGSSLSATITLEDADGNPVPNTEVSVLNTIEYGGIPIGSTTVVTNSTGQATVSFDVPATLYHNADGELMAQATVNNSTIQGADYYDILRYTVSESDSYIGTVTAGGEFTKTITVRNASTGDPIEGMPFYMVGTYTTFKKGSFGAQYATTNASGQVSLSTTVPTDAAGEIRFAFMGPVGGQVYESPAVQGFDAQVNGINWEVAPGETVSFNYTIGAQMDASAIVTVSTWDEDEVEEPVIHSSIAQPGEEITVTIPSTTPDGTYFDVSVVIMGENGSTQTVNEYLWITQDSQNEPPVASFTVSPGSPEVNETVTLDASASSDVDGSISAYQWDLDNDGNIEATGETVTHTFDSNGSYTVSLTVVDNDGASATTKQVVSVGGPGPLPGFSSPPTDLDSDGALEDVNGNGEFDIGDVQALFANRDSEVVQSNVEAFDHNNNGEIDIGDIQALFQDYMNS